MPKIDISDLTPELLALIEQHKTVGTRTPVRGRLTDLRMPQSAKARIARPHFEWSAEEPPEGTTIPPYPRLFWDAEGKEIVVPDADTFVDPTWTPYPPLSSPETAQERLQRELNALSPEDRQFVLAEERKARLGKLQSGLSGLSATSLDKIKDAMPSAAPAVVEPVAEPVKVAAKK